MYQCDRHTANIYTARCMPVFITGLIGYASWVFLGQLCTNYLLNPPKYPTENVDTPYIITNPTPQKATAIGLIVGYLTILVLMLITYYRLVFTVLTNPGFTPLGPTAYGRTGEGKDAWSPAVAAGARNEKQLAPKSGSHDSETSVSATNGNIGPADQPSRLGDEYRSLSSRAEDMQAMPPRQPLTQVFLRDIYTCDSNGEPRWCGRCGNWKPDRTHHCSEVGRCVENFDHFCPWVGGVVGLTSFKFFLQFITYGSIYCIFVVIVIAVHFKQKVSRYGFASDDGHWVAVLALGGFFGLFLVGMVFSNLQMAYWGVTTLENFDRKTKRYYVAVLDSNQEAEPSTLPTRLNPRNTDRAPQPFFSRDDGTRDLDSGFQRRVLLPLPAPEIQSPQTTASTSSDNTSRRRSKQVAPAPRRWFKIYLTPPGLHPWKIGFARNFKSVMGPRFFDWILATYRPYHRPRSRDDGELAEETWSSKQLWKQMNIEGWAAPEQGAAKAREESLRSWYEFGDKFLEFIEQCNHNGNQR